jgi:hypothetical protein
MPIFEVSMLPLQPRQGPHNPVQHTVPRRPGSIRRTSTIDMLRPHGAEGTLVLAGHARDLSTDQDGCPRELARASLDVDVDFLGGKTVVSISSDPDRPGLGDLIGANASSGFRARVADAVPAEVATGTALYQLLDDVPVATLISRYAVSVEGRQEVIEQSGPYPPTDICAGFQSGGSLMAEIDRRGHVPMLIGPVAPAVEDGSDPLAWHDVSSLPVGAMRRRRLMDVVHGDPLAVHSWFRDTYHVGDGEERIIHEYALDAQVEPGTSRLLQVSADPRVLPWLECPTAAASAARLTGTSVQGLRNRVRADFTGTSTCTHLNDALRMLADVVLLAGAYLA